jgi:formamidopyrimidine-DNA glycosylase
MPELPEAETIVRGLRPHLPGRRIREVEVIHRDLIEGEAPEFVRDLTRAGIRAVERRGKNLVLEVRRNGDRPGHGEPDRLHRLVINLGMSGRLLLLDPGGQADPPSHPGVRFHLVDGGVLVYHDVRRFGRLSLMSADGYRAWSRRLGPEPLSRSFTAGRLADALAASVSPVRSWLLDQRRVAGVHPRTPAREVSGAAVPRLHRALRRVLREAIRARGTTLRDYRTAAGDEGSYSGTLRVYGREGAPCPRCRSPVERTVFGNRSAFLCPRCQPEP